MRARAPGAAVSLLASAGLALAAGCSTPAPPRKAAPDAGGAGAPASRDAPASPEAPEAPDAEGEALASQLLPSESIRPGMSLRQRLRFRTGEAGGGRQASFEAVVQADCREVLVVGLTPFGTRLFTIRQVGRETRFEWMFDEPWPFRPEHILLDVHRAFLHPLADPPRPDGRHPRRFGGAQGAETWRDGRLMERVVEETGGPEAALWTARYEGGWGADVWPGTVRIESARYGYTIEITTLERRPLACPP
ncbi:MAG: DUF3261 domain-containing protein [Myxococcota bacterium]